MFEHAWLEHTQIRQLRRSEYERLAEEGAFTDERVELLAGVIVKVSPQGFDHSDLLVLIAEYLQPRIPATHQVRSQVPLALSEYSMPEPDVAVVQRKAFGSPHPSSAALVIEVSVSSLPVDRIIKAQIYAAAGIADYWVVNGATLELEVHRAPVDGQYTSIVTHDQHADVRPLAFPDIALCLADLIAATRS